ncbi:hypothetical protein QBC44DRAFT_334033 [Cladorrhinum sp. PSN332]|nr:hypothetical protein QBC44DRAFT_334033 [Cladorrhinum sp. PSN332]
MISRRVLGAAGIVTSLSLVWFVASITSEWERPSISVDWGSNSAPEPETSLNLQPASGVLPHVENYFQQVFSAGRPAPYAYPALKEVCDHAPWRTDDVYLKCGGMSAGLTSIVSQIKVCLKMALDTGTHLVLPAMPLRDSKDLKDFHFMDGDAYMTYDKWFDAPHLRDVFGKACPKLKIIHPDDMNKKVPVKHQWSISCGDAWGYRKIHSYFWAGRPFKHFFESKLWELYRKEEAEPTPNAPKKGITVIDIDSEFLLYKITDDPTRRDLRLWNDLSHVVRFLEVPRKITNRVLQKLGPEPFYGVHFRVENDTIWSSLDNQLKVDLDALDKAWKKYGNKPGQKKPKVYLACGDSHQVERFVEAGKERGWEVTHKWRLADEETTKMIDDLPFDFQGAVDMGVMVRSEFFLGITGSAFSSTIANQRDATGRYRGSSFEVIDDEGARTHLFNDLDADEYACCL